MTRSRAAINGGGASKGHSICARSPGRQRFPADLLIQLDPPRVPRAPEAGISALLLRAAVLRAARDDEHRIRWDARLAYPVPPRSLLVLLTSHPTCEVHHWPSLASVERAMRLQRRSVNRLLRDLEERGILDIRQRDFASNKVGAS